MHEGPRLSVVNLLRPAVVYVVTIAAKHETSRVLFTHDVEELT